MYVWNQKGRRDRRHFASTGLETLDPSELQSLQEKEKKIRADEEVQRYKLEHIEIEKFVRLAEENLISYFDTRNGKDEVSAVGECLMTERANAEKAAKERASAAGEDVEDDDGFTVLKTTEKKGQRKPKFTDDNSKKSLSEYQATVGELFEAKKNGSVKATKELMKKAAEQKEALVALTGCSDQELEAALQKMSKEAGDENVPETSDAESQDAEKMKRKKKGKIKKQNYHKSVKAGGEDEDDDDVEEREALDPNSIEAILEAQLSDLNAEQKMKLKVGSISSILLLRAICRSPPFVVNHSPYNESLAPLLRPSGVPSIWNVRRRCIGNN